MVDTSLHGVNSSGEWVEGVDVKHPGVRVSHSFFLSLYFTYRPYRTENCDSPRGTLKRGAVERQFCFTGRGTEPGRTVRMPDISPGWRSRSSSEVSGGGCLPSLRRSSAMESSWME
jgi:hypothetical protein